MNSTPITRAPKTDRQRGPLPDDTPRFYELIRELIDLKYFVWRPSKHHIKHGEANFWPSTGTITIDNVGRHPEKGKQAFIALLQRMYPRHRRPCPEAPMVHEDPQSPVTVLELNLDDEIPGNPSSVQKRIDDDDTPW